MDKVTIRRGGILINLLYLLVIIIAVLLFFKYAFGWIAPFLLGLMVTLMIEPLTKFIIKKVKVNRAFAGTVTVLLFWLVFGFLIFEFFNMIVSEVYSLFSNNLAITASTKNFIGSLNNRLFLEYNKLPIETQNIFLSAFSKLSDSLTSVLTNVTTGLFNFITNFLSSLPNVFVFLTAAIISSFFFTIDYPRIRKFITMQIPTKHYPAVVHTKNFIFNTIVKVIKAYSIIMLITFSILLIGFKIIGINYALLIAILIVLVDALPVLGCSTVLLPWSIISMIMGDFRMGVGVFVITVAVWITRQIAEPRIVGHHLGMHPLVTLIAMYIGLVTFGLSGVFLFPIVIMFLKNMQELGHLKIWKTEADFKEKPHPSQNEDF